MLISAFNAYQSDDMACLMLISVDKTWNRFISNRPLFRRRSVQLEFFAPAKSNSWRFRLNSLICAFAHLCGNRFFLPAGKSARIYLLVLFFGGSRGQKAGKKKRWCGQKGGKKKRWCWQKAGKKKIVRAKKWAKKKDSFKIHHSLFILPQ